MAKIKNAFNGPWEIVDKLKDGSYSIKHCVTGQSGKRHAKHLSPFPQELIPLVPVDGPDLRFSESNAPIKENPFSEASIKGYEPFEPYQEPLQPKVLNSNLADESDLHFPTLAELNDKISDLDSSDEEYISKHDELSEEFEVFYLNPDTNVWAPAACIFNATPDPPAAPPIPPPCPSLAELTPKIIASHDKLFFISHWVPGSDAAEWSLVRIPLTDSLSLHPSSMQDGKFLVEFYICHPDDKAFNGTNQRYWLEYHS